MARFYNTSKTDFIDYDRSGTQTPPKGDSISTLFGDLNSIPEDRARLNDIIQGYQGRVQELSSALQTNPNGMNMMRGDIMGLKQDLQRDMNAGELKAIQDRYTTYTERREAINDVFKNKPGLADAALNQMTIEDLNFDPSTGTYGAVAAPDVVRPFETKDLNDWLKSQESVINEDFIGRIQDKEQLDKYTTLYERGELKGVLKEDVIKQLAANVTPDMIASASQERTLRGDTSVDESAFYTNGQLDLTTTYGRIIDATADNIARQVRDTQFIKDQDEGKLEYAKQAARVWGKGKIQANDGMWMADKMVAMRNGNAEVANQASEAIKGRETEDGGIVERITPAADGNPATVVVSYEEPILNDEDVLDTNGVPTGETRRVPLTIINEKGEAVPATQRVSYPKELNMATMETIYGQKEMSKVRKAFIEMDEYDVDRADMKNVERKKTPLSQ